MGFFDFMTRMAAGRPIFEDPKTGGEPVSAPADSTVEPALNKTDEHSFPVVEVRRMTCHLSGNQVQIYCMIANAWKEDVMLDKIHLLGTKRELDTPLRPGELREFLVYSGPVPTREYHEAQIDYKTQREGDYFAAIHDMSFTYHPDTKTYMPDDMKVRLPIRDIYG